ncbi:hypothetical protein GE107_18755 [Cohnella sp. CFH 77786]|uniref:hypothetical protein n=1 Tax=Cohnella sp. CFH 77786 TaxID=2662265 RepID=UPI001C60FE64|nr:hypothetical protein [Cohnella sp. CFH 77786]MBW5448101.1 hypothetical protein [Cohnella sp. CFH 77786]
MQEKKKLILIITTLMIIFYIVLFPSPTPEIAVRKHLFLSFHPIKAFVEKVHEGGIKNDPRYGDLYIVESLDTPFLYAKKNFLGWRIVSTGSGP